MEVFQNFWFLLVQLSIFYYNVEADPLMGPFRCPSDAKCVDSKSCTIYYLTADGRPYHCGPREQIDSMVCCYNPTTAPIKIHYSSFYEEDSGAGDQNDDDLDPNHTSDKNEPHQIPLPNLIQDEYENEAAVEDVAGQDNIIHFNHPGDENTLKEFQSTSYYERDPVLSDLPSDNDDEVPYQQNPQEPILYRTHDFEDIPLTHNAPPHRQTHDQPLYHQQPFTDFDNHIASQEQARRDSRQSNYNNYGNDCICEKGDKGDRGPPGEPGKIIYVPVFVSSNLNVPYSGEQQYGNPTRNYQFSYPEPQKYHPNFVNHPNPTVVPYSVPSPTTHSGPIIIPQAGQPNYYQPPIQPQPFVMNQIQRPGIRRR